MEEWRGKAVWGWVVVVLVLLGLRVEGSPPAGRGEVGNFHRGKPRTCRTETVAGGVRCPTGKVCVVSTLGRPEVDIPHSGYCGRARRGKQCFYKGYYYQTGVDGIPTGDGCNFCSCEAGGVLKCSNKTAVTPCLTDPCAGKTCLTYPSAICRANYCGGCSFDFFLDSDSSSTKVTSSCGTSCNCTQPSDPEEQVCGKDGRNYASACFADCVNVTSRPGDCRSACICPKILSPVCGSDGTTYGNSCTARCAFVDKMRPGECSVVCACSDDRDPVCGSDGKTYTNKCMADCHFVTSYVPGACE
ncbi:hypothetical protein CBR_g25853 [Chara braunii]|uniref:Kazal-like domain-containing protein n=1 Tax=Chara braunii TaxID=69332 RepID=A0A388L6Q3_CHABU|nr:hypothetical protein CBR_g25853 [Chara braunii]|eukprot:GBG77922.1 hypothetical protein CBR_g25853 [Chara braunii]